MKKLSFLLLLILAYTSVFADTTQSPEMDDILRSSGKIYVVVLVIVIIFVGLAIFLFSIDRRLKKIENEK